MLKNNKILVTGGAGFIGSHLVSQLVGGNDQIIVLDKQILPDSVFAKEKLEKKVVFEKIDIRDRERTFDVFARYKPSYVIHLAAQTIVTVAFDDPLETLESNILGTVNILEASRVVGNIKRILFASSDKAYGKTKKAYTEDSPLVGDHPYDVSKSSADLIAQTYFKTYNLPVVITRFGNVYGAGDLHLDRLIPGICEAVIKKKTLAVRSNGKYVRDYLYVKDVVDGYLSLLYYKHNIAGEAYNFSSKETLSVIEVIKRAEKILGEKINYKILNTAKNEIPYQHLDDSKIRKMGWKTRFTLSETLRSICEWYKVNIF